MVPRRGQGPVPGTPGQSGGLVCTGRSNREPGARSLPVYVCVHMCAPVCEGEGGQEVVLRACEELQVSSLLVPRARRPLWGCLYGLCTDVAPWGFLWWDSAVFSCREA